MTRTPMPQLSHADRRSQLDALMANYTGPLTHIASAKLSPSGVRRLNQADIVCSKCGRPGSAGGGYFDGTRFLFFQVDRVRTLNLTASIPKD